ncbi:DUF86 domain-containing protein [Aquincola sp. S2]|uniref:DUF86 domain-containing protein n=1 Tax=Pseudaquabacterium terrae TaxID=2732868 RepID=A0ABX2EQW2_9BURK|nr:DUF86 domain-containing protein [Aquabacterium terrae]NRF70927.1 DUF86 domain-containing protein [Aquabacterium terrae]
MTPSTESDAVLLAHMADCLARISDYTGGIRQRFDASSLVQDAVVRNLQMLTESSQRLSDAVKSTEPGQPWRELSGFRNIVVHAYLSLDLSIVWSIIENDLPGLRDAVQRMIAQSTSDGPPA